jgi:hypothetical protein
MTEPQMGGLALFLTILAEALIIGAIPALWFKGGDGVEGLPSFLLWSGIFSLTVAMGVFFYGLD